MKIWKLRRKRRNEKNSGSVTATHDGNAFLRLHESRRERVGLPRRKLVDRRRLDAARKIKMKRIQILSVCVSFFVHFGLALKTYAFHETAYVCGFLFGYVGAHSEFIERTLSPAQKEKSAPTAYLTEGGQDGMLF